MTGRTPSDGAEECVSAKGRCPNGESDGHQTRSDKLRGSTNDPASVQMRSAELSPKQNGLCAEFNSKTKAGAYAGFKRAVVTDLRVAFEEPPTREFMTQFLLFQITPRDTGCFPDTQSIRILQ